MHGFVTSRTAARSRCVCGGLVLLCSACLVAQAQAADAPVFPYRDAYPLERGGWHAEATLDVQPRIQKQGEPFTCDIRFTNHGPGVECFNPFFIGLLPYPAAVAVFDADGKYMGDRLGPGGRSRTFPEPSDRVFVHGGGYVGVTIRRNAGRVFGALGRSSLLPPGKYRLQVIYYAAFLSFAKAKPADLRGEEALRFWDDFDRTELLRSNIVEIEIVAAEPEPHRRE